MMEIHVNQSRQFVENELQNRMHSLSIPESSTVMLATVARYTLNAQVRLVVKIQNEAIPAYNNPLNAPFLAQSPGLHVPFSK